MDWTIRLEGGPADGDEGLVEGLPEKLWVAFCHECADWHWWDQPEQGCEVYARQDHDDDALVARYVYRDIDFHGLDQLDREAELTAV